MADQTLKTDLREELKVITSSGEKDPHDIPLVARDAESLSRQQTVPLDVELQPVQMPISHDFETVEKSETRRSNVLVTTLSTTLSRFRTSDSIQLTPPPDGGFQAWLVACMSHLVNFNTWGFINTFGLFETYYVNTMKIGNNSSVAWIGALQVWILFTVGVFSGRALDAGYFHVVYITGTIIYLIGMFMLSLCTTYWQVFLAQALCVGFGFGLVFVPSIALSSTYFLKKRSTALGITVTGSSTGAIVFPLIAEYGLPKIGFAWTIRVMAFVQLACAIIAGIFMKPRLPPRKSGPLVEWAAFKELPFTLYAIGSYFFFWGVYIGFFYVGSYGHSILQTPQSTNINLLLVMNSMGVPGRLIPNTLADRLTGPLNWLLPSVIATGIVLLSWIAVKSVTGLWVFAIVYGLSAASIQGLFPVVLTSLTTDPKKTGVRTGMGFAIIGLAVLTGPPIAGALVQVANGSYIGLQIFAAGNMFVAFFFLFAVRWTRAGWNFTVKV